MSDVTVMMSHKIKSHDNHEKIVHRPYSNCISSVQEMHVLQLCYRPVVTYCIVYHYTKKATLARLLANKSLAIYVVHLNRYFVIPL